MTSLTALDGPLTVIEAQLDGLGTALRDRNPQAIERHAAELQRALALAVHRFAQAARSPEGVPTELRQRLARASGQVAAQRQSLARATAALDRAIDVLMPEALPASVYGQAGVTGRAHTSGCANA